MIVNTKETRDAYYDERWLLENQRSTPPNQKRVDLVVESVARHIGRHYEPGILEIGCGNGWILDAVSKRLGPTAKLYGIEPSATGIQNTLKRVPKAVVQCCTLDSAHFDRKFDVVICSEVLEHVSSQADFVAQITRFMGKKSILVLTTPNGRYRDIYFDTCMVEPQTVEKWLMPGELKRLLLLSFASVRLTTFDLSFWYQKSSRIQRFRRALWKFRGGWRLWKSIEGIFRFFGCCGLYILVNAKNPRNHG